MMVTFVWWVTCERRQRTVVVLTAVDVLVLVAIIARWQRTVGGGRAKRTW